MGDPIKSIIALTARIVHLIIQEIFLSIFTLLIMQFRETEGGQHLGFFLFPRRDRLSIDHQEFSGGDGGRKTGSAPLTYLSPILFQVNRSSSLGGDGEFFPSNSAVGESGDRG